MEKLLFSLVLFAFSFLGKDSNAIINPPFETYTKTKTREFKSYKNGSVAIEAQYSHVEVIIWDKPTVRIKTRLEVKANNESVANEGFKEIEVNELQVKEKIASKININPEAKILYRSDAAFKIHQWIFLPADQFLDFQLHRSHLTLPKLQRKVSVDLNHGKITGEKLSGLNYLYLHFADCFIKSIDSLRGELVQSDINVSDIEYLEVASSRCDIKIKQSGTVRCKAKYDNYQINQVKKLYYQGQYDEIWLGHVSDGQIRAKGSTFVIDSVKQTISFDCTEGKVSVGNVLPSLQGAQFSGYKTHFEIGLDRQTNYKLEGLARFAGIKYPSEANAVTDKNSPSEHYLILEKGNASKSPILVKLNYGGMRIK